MNCDYLLDPYQLTDLIFHDYCLKISEKKLSCFMLFDFEGKTTNFVQLIKLY